MHIVAEFFSLVASLDIGNDDCINRLSCSAVNIIKPSPKPIWANLLNWKKEFWLG